MMDTQKFYSIKASLLLLCIAGWQ